MKTNLLIFQKSGIYVDKTLLSIYVHKILSRYLKKTEFCYSEGRERPFSRCSMGFMHFPNFQVLADLSRSKSVLGTFSRFFFLRKLT